MASAVQVSTHSRLKAAELYGVLFILIGIVSTHSRPKAAAASSWLPFSWSERFNTQPPEGGWNDENSSHEVPFAFQHTAARRRLDEEDGDEVIAHVLLRFNTQPPEGGCGGCLNGGCCFGCFNTQPPEGGCS